MTKGSAKSSRVITATTPLPQLKQARLTGVNDYAKSVRQKSTTPNSASSELKQAGLTAFGFRGANASKKSKTPDRRDAIETPPQKRRKKLTGNLEIPETQFAQNTQSPEPGGHDSFANSYTGDEYSSPLSSPPPEGSSPILPPSISSSAAMPPPPAPAMPVTPKRRRVVEVPDSKSPPFTPFTPYASQQQKDQLSSQASPTARLSKSPVTSGMDEDSEIDGCRSPTPVPTQILPQRLFQSLKSLPRLKRLWEDEDGIRGEREKAARAEGVMESVEVASSDRDKIIKSSQWWENEDTQDAPLSTQYTQEKQVGETSPPLESLQQDMGIRPAHEEAPFHVDLSYQTDPPIKATNDNEAYEPQSTSRMNNEEDIQGSFHSMSYPVPLKFYDDTPNPESDTGDDPAFPVDGDSTATEEDHEDMDGLNESEAYPIYGAYRTQQLPSSFYQHNTYRHSSPEFPPSSQFAPLTVINQSSPGLKNESRGEEEQSQFLPRVTEELDIVTGDGNSDEEPSQFLPRMTGDVNMVVRDDSQFLPAMINESDTAMRGGRVDNTHEGEERDGNIKGEEDDDGGGEVRGRRTGTVTRSQLLPSELMETFPMPPPLSQFSSYGPYDYEYRASETQ